MLPLLDMQLICPQRGTRLLLHYQFGEKKETRWHKYGGPLKSFSLLSNFSNCAFTCAGCGLIGKTIGGDERQQKRNLAVCFLPNFQSGNWVLLWFRSLPPPFLPPPLWCFRDFHCSFLSTNITMNWMYKRTKLLVLDHKLRMCVCVYICINWSLCTWGKQCGSESVCPFFSLSECLFISAFAAAFSAFNIFCCFIWAPLLHGLRRAIGWRKNKLLSKYRLAEWNSVPVLCSCLLNLT